MMKNINEFEGKMIKTLKEKAQKSSTINPELFEKYQVKRGLRDVDGRGVLVGLTEIGEVRSYIVEENETVPIPGKLIYRGIDISYLVNGFLNSNRFGFEETCYFLLFGNLPTKQELKDFEQLLAGYRKLPDDFVRDMILKMPIKT
jgi:citrate synthase